MNDLTIPDGVFPLTERECKELGQMGWQSGFGWRDTPDWYHEPSNGPLIFIDEDAKWLAKFCDDLAVIRRQHAEERMRAAGVELYEALARIEPNIGWRGKADDDLESDLFHCEFCAGSAADDEDIPHHDECPVYQIRAALAKARGES